VRLPRLRKVSDLLSHAQENLMPDRLASHAPDNRLRFVYNDAVVSFSVASDVTFGEIAQTLDCLSSEREDNPVAIDVTLLPRIMVR
jgi:hypothetical protein